MQPDSAPSPTLLSPSTVVSVWLHSQSFLKSQSPRECFLGFMREEVGWESLRELPTCRPVPGNCLARETTATTHPYLDFKPQKKGKPQGHP